MILQVLAAFSAATCERTPHFLFLDPRNPHAPALAAVSTLPFCRERYDCVTMLPDVQLTQQELIGAASS